MRSRKGLAHAGGGAIPIHGGIHGDVDRVFDFAPLAFRKDEKSSNNKEEDLHGMGHGVWKQIFRQNLQNLQEFVRQWLSLNKK